MTVNRQVNSSLDELVKTVRDTAQSYTCSADDAVVYAIEDVVTSILGARAIHRRDIETFVHEVCSLSDINSPNVVVTPSSSRVVGAAYTDHHLMCLNRTKSSVLTVLHEIAHFTATNDAHGRHFRDSFVRLVRQHVGVEHASMLHVLYRACDLDVSEWGLLQL